MWLTGSRAQAQQLWRTGPAAPWHVGSSGPGIKPVSPALAGRLLSTAPPGKPLLGIFEVLPAAYEVETIEAFTTMLLRHPATVTLLSPLTWYFLLKN